MASTLSKLVGLIWFWNNKGTEHVLRFYVILVSFCCFTKIEEIVLFRPNFILSIVIGQIVDTGKYIFVILNFQVLM